MRYLLTILVLLPGILSAQVHIKNQNFLQLNIGAYDGFAPNMKAFSTSIEWGKYNKKLNSKILGFGINHKKTLSYSNETNTVLDFKIPVTHYFAFLKSDVTFYRNATKIFHIKGTGQVNLGYESINNESKVSNSYTLSTSSEYLLGIGVGIQIEYCPIVVGLTENVNFLSKYQKLSTVPYVGYRFHFY